MRKLIYYFMSICVLSTFCLADAKAVNTNPKNAIAAPKSTESEEVQAMLDRIHEIKTMEMSTLTKVEKKELRNELRNLKQEARATQGIYLSIGALIIIILLLILIL